MVLDIKVIILITFILIPTLRIRAIGVVYVVILFVSYGETLLILVFILDLGLFYFDLVFLVAINYYIVLCGLKTSREDLFCHLGIFNIKKFASIRKSSLLCGVIKLKT